MALTRPTTTQVSHPHPIKRRIFNFSKSAVRIVACVALAYYEIQLAAVLFVVAEVINIVEEFV
jgi:hypothetical protein